MLHERLNIYLTKSDIIRRRNTSMVTLMPLKAINKIKDSSDKKAKKHKKQRKKKWGEQQQILINRAKQNYPNQNATNLCNLKKFDSAKTLLSKASKSFL